MIAGYEQARWVSRALHRTAKVMSSALFAVAIASPVAARPAYKPPAIVNSSNAVVRSTNGAVTLPPVVPPPAANHKPAAQGAKTRGQLDYREFLLLNIAIVVAGVLGALISIYPIWSYIWHGWGWREHMITSSLSKEAKDNYLIFYHKEKPDKNTAEKRFLEFHNKWCGRSRLILPAVYVVIITFIYTQFLASTGAQALYGRTMIFIPLHHQLLRIAIAAVAGAYTMVSFDAISRVARRDLLPEDLYVFSLRLIACVPVANALASFVKNDAALVVAFGTSTLSLQFITNFLRKNLMTRVNAGSPVSDDPKADDPISLLAGVDAAVAERMASIGITTIWQLAASDPVQLTMRTNLNFTYLLDLTSQAIAWTCLGDKISVLRPMGLGGAYELAVMNLEARDATSPHQANSLALISQAAAALNLTSVQMSNILHCVCDDPRTMFLIKAYGA